MNAQDNREKLEVLIPIYNEEACIDELVSRLLVLRAKMKPVDVWFTFIDDGSRDQSVSKLLTLTSQYPFIRLLTFSRNFGHQMAVTAGLDHADADYVAIIDADLQDPPELIEAMLQKAKEGFDIVYGKRKMRKGETLFKKITAAIFYRLLTQLCEISIPLDTGDFRLITRSVVDALKKMREPHRFLRGMVPWVGFKSAPVEYKREARHSGQTKYPLQRMIRFAFDAIFSFSMSPIRIATAIGIGIVILTSLATLFVLYLRLFTPYTIPGITAVLITVAMLGGLQIMMLGVIGEYVGRTFEATKNRPLYIIKDRINF